MSKHAAAHARQVAILRAGVAGGFVALTLSSLVMLLTEQSMLTHAVLGIGSFLALISPGWALLTLHDPPEVEAVEAA